MKKYHQLLGEYIEQSGLTITELAKRLKESGLNTDRTYLSRLKNNTTPPASEELNKNIAEITGNDSEELIFLAYLEKSPEKLKSYVENAHQLEMQLDFEIAISFMDDNSFLLGKNKVTEFLEEKGIEGTSTEKLLDLLNKRLNIFEKWQLVNLLTSKTTILSHPLSSIFSSKHYFPINELLNNGNEIPLLKFIYGNRLYMREDYLGGIRAETNYPDYSGLISVVVPDDCLLDYSIKKGAKAIIALTEEFNQEDIFLVSYQDSPGKLRKIQIHHNLLILRPLNSNMEIEIIEKTSAFIIGKLVEVISSKVFK